MKLVVTDSIKKLELEPHENMFGLEVVKAAAKKALGGLGVRIKNTFRIKGTEVVKVHITSPSGAGRVIFLIQISNVNAALLLLRHKNDKKIGANMSIENPHFRKILDRRITCVLSDLRDDRYGVFDL